MRRFLTGLLKILVGTVTGSLACAAGCGWFAWGFWTIRFASPYGFAGLFLVAVYGLTTCYLLIAVHELGHALAAVCVRFRVHRIVIGPLDILRAENGYRLLRPSSLFKFNGRVESYPLDDGPLRARYTAVIGAGPLANFLFAGLCAGAALALNSSFPGDAISALVPRNPASALIGFAAWYSVALALGNLIPGRRNGVDWDGKKLLDLLLGGKRVERLLQTLRMNAYILNGVRARDWPVPQMDRLLAARDGSAADVIANFLGYCHALDGGHFERAGELLDLALSQRGGCPITYRSALLLEGAFYEGYYRNNASAALSWLVRAMTKPETQAARLRAQAAMLFAEGHYEEAILHADAALIAAATLPDFESDKDLLCALLADCRRRLSATEESGASDGAATLGAP